MEEKTFSLKDVEKHNQISDAWIVLHKNVYNITDFIDNHPGGDIIKYGIGKDATEMFKNAGHGNDALEFMNHYKIGKLKFHS